MKLASGTGTYDPLLSTSKVVLATGLTAALVIAVSFVFALDLTLGLKSNVSLRSYVPEVAETYLGICGVTIAVVLDVDSLGSITYESTEAKPIPPERL